MSYINEFQYPDGWYMRVGQIYSSPYEPYHVRITSIRTVDDDWFIGYVALNPRNYNEPYYDGELNEWEEDYAYAWWFNEGVWDLEKEPNTIHLNNGSMIKMMQLGENVRGKQSEYFFGFDLAKESDW